MKMRKSFAAATLGVASLSVTPPVQAQDYYMGQIIMVGFTYCPRNTMSAEGQLLAIASNSALFSLYGTTYGGDGRTTFQLPDLRGRVPIGQGTGPGLSTRQLGEIGGSETNIMTIAQMPAHNHRAGLQTSDMAANTNDPRKNSFATSAGNVYSTSPPDRNFMATDTITVDVAGGGQPQNNMQPFLALRYCVVAQGIFPPRN